MSLPQLPVPRSLREMIGDAGFVKVTGPAGDWIVFADQLAVPTLRQDQVIALCNRRNGIGATGVVVVTGTAQHQEDASARPHLAAWRADGSAVEDLTEAARAATSVMATLSIIEDQQTSHHVFQTPQGLLTTVYTPAYIGVDIGQWSYPASELAQETGADVLVMTAGLTDPRPGLSITIHYNHVTIAVESIEELEAIDLTQQPSIEPAPELSTSIGFVVPQEPLIADGMAQLLLRHISDADHHHDLASATAAAAVAFQDWSGLHQVNLWNVTTPLGDIVVQLHDDNRLSTFARVPAIFFGHL